MSGARLIVMARLPGRGKTRLARELGPEAAKALSEAMLLDTLEALGRVAAPRLLAVADGLVEEARAYADPSWQLVPQRGEGLAARLRAAHADAGGGRAVFVGTDAPAMDAARVEAALEALDGAEVVIGPADDGGYDLIALARPIAEVFDDALPWSTPELLEATRARLRAAHIPWRELAPSFDVDEAEDLRRALGRLDPSRRTRAVALRYLGDPARGG